ncbi:MAG: hypothetical protein H6721_34605 [Sandaracinus sp.]|nr:hypothetical protein [Sandaracinus sp.]
MAFRDEVEALRAQRDTLLARVRAGDGDDATREALAEVRVRIDETRRELSQRIVDGARGARHCPAAWDAMVGGDAARFCGICDKTVYDFSGLTSYEAAALLVRHEGELCARLWRRRDETVLTSDCDVGRSRGRRRLTVVGAALFTTSALGAAVGAPDAASLAAVPERTAMAPDFDAETFLHGPELPGAYDLEAPPVPDDAWLDGMGWRVSVDDSYSVLGQLDGRGSSAAQLFEVVERLDEPPPSEDDPRSR